MPHDFQVSFCFFLCDVETYALLLLVSSFDKGLLFLKMKSMMREKKLSK